MILHVVKPMEIPSLVASNPARAFAANGEATSAWIIIWKPRFLHLRFGLSNPRLI
ncbi:hypothetical protein ES332_A02G135400v1 [Gossypium tomentosum]|uniref:Uncharacterized protein n=1 Tax=Gossypium tomentosum TaxID=34277 RepID=A0A5D2RIP8_GOSTO|nr:hypothetical protein ES332_A02G135400v1 [Gossypium tomentosum]